MSASAITHPGPSPSPFEEPQSKPPRFRMHGWAALIVVVPQGIPLRESEGWASPG